MTLRALSFRLLPVVALALLLAAPALAGWPNDPTVNVPVCPSTAGAQGYPNTISDGAGGAIVVWRDERNGHYELYAQRVSAQGHLMWTPTGVPIRTVTGDLQIPLVVQDGQGGAIVTWHDQRSVSNWDLYAQRISADGVIQWTPNGILVCNATSGDGPQHRSVADGYGGVVLAWRDIRNGGGNPDLFAQRISATGAVQWTANGVPLCTASDEQLIGSIVGDGTGGAIVAWQDRRSGTNYDIYAQRVSPGGVVQWAADGVSLCTTANQQMYPVLATDGQGGAIAVWEDVATSTNWDVYAQRISDAGTVQWTANGVAICTWPATDAQADIVADDAGGAIIAWTTSSSTASVVYAQRVSAAGATRWQANGVPLYNFFSTQGLGGMVRDGRGGALIVVTDQSAGNVDLRAFHVFSDGTFDWPASNGVPVSTASGDQFPWNWGSASDGQGGAIVGWTDTRGGATTRVYMQHVDLWGCLGPQPTITSVQDVPADQGGWISLAFTASPEDGAGHGYVDQYVFWRQVPQAAASAALARGARLTRSDDPATPDRNVILTTASGSQTYYWEYMGAMSASGYSSYSNIYMTTRCDSVAGSNPRTLLMVEGRWSSGTVWRWFSDPDSGYSVDNLAPAAPAPFTGSYSGGTATLSWGASSATDFAVFRLYRGTSSAFVPGPGNLVRTQAGTGYADAAGAPCFYKLTAVDIHGNVSPYAFLQPAGTTDAPGAGLPRELALSAPAPNPLRGSCTMRLALPRGANVALAVYDQQGRRVRALLAGALPAGEHPVAWDGRDDGGRPVANGIFFVRCEAEGRTLTRRIVAIR